MSVLLPLPLAGAYDYAAPPHLSLDAGDFVVVPLGPRQVVGVVWGPSTGDVAAAKVKSVVEKLPAVPLTEELRRFVDWVASYTLSPPGAVLRMVMRVPDALLPARTTTGYALSRSGHATLAAAEASLTAARRRVLEALKDMPPAPAADIARRAGCGAGVVRALVQLGLLEAVEIAIDRVADAPDWRRAGPRLSSAQELAANDLIAKVKAGGFGVTLLDGVTGSGKTEVYFAAIAAAIERGSQALVLLPEIALSAQWLQRFAERFGAPPAQWHSDLSHRERR
ncbi:MAG TPA: DEAD/DEAH box helicase family protein, partial [Stellaceae bacterium]|nr:DEAD/DEAH box helicase family protein [Stellaceae bacterium]